MPNSSGSASAVRSRHSPRPSGSRRAAGRRPNLLGSATASSSPTPRTRMPSPGSSGIIRAASSSDFLPNSPSAPAATRPRPAACGFSSISRGPGPAGVEASSTWDAGAGSSRSPPPKWGDPAARRRERSDGARVCPPGGNAKRHGVAGRIEFVEDDAVRLMDEPPAVRWDLIAANLFSDLLVTLFSRFPRTSRQGRGK